MADYWDVGSFKKTKNDKAIFIRLGSAKPRDDGGFSMWLDAMPTPGPSGQYEIQVLPQREKKAGNDKPAPSTASDEIPW